MDERAAEHRVRVRVFIDFWNFQLALNKPEPRFEADWRELGPLLAREAVRVVDETGSLTYQGMNVYGSYGKNDSDLRLLNWANQTLSSFPGVHVKFLERRRKRSGPVCPSCHKEVSICPHCDGDMRRGTEEKGVDTRIATEMISLAWTDNYEVAVLVSSDRDFIPVVEFLETKGIKVVHGAFPPAASELTRKCWGSIIIPHVQEQFRRIP